MGYLCSCGLWTVGHEVILEHIPSLRCPQFFSPVIPYIFLDKKTDVVVDGLLFDGLWPLEMI